MDTLSEKDKELLIKELKPFLTQKDIIDAINKNDWEYVYNRIENTGGTSAARLTALLFELGIYTFEYMKKIPRYSASGIPNLTMLKIPTNVEEIAFGAFKYCPNLYSITLEHGVKYIDNEAFASCFNLTKVILPDTLEFIGNQAFADCTNLNSIILPKSLDFIDDYVFVHSGLKTIYYTGTSDEWDILMDKSVNTYLSEEIKSGNINLEFI